VGKKRKEFHYGQRTSSSKRKRAAQRLRVEVEYTNIDSLMIKPRALFLAKREEQAG
jgi:hypothetical protein